MSDIVTRVLISRIDEIGSNIDDLSQLAPLAADPADSESVEAVSLSHKDSGQPGAVQMQNICNALAISKISNDSGEWAPVLDVGPGECDDVPGVADVKFIFERPGEKIIVVPHKNALAFAKQEPPLEEGNYLKAIARDEVLAISDELAEAMGANADLQPHTDAIVGLLNTLIEERFPEGEPMQTLFQQLGSYTCRQCG